MNSRSEYDPAPVSALIPREFIRRRLHSISGIFLVIFLVEHLLTNSQAALWIGDDGKGFVEAVNWIHSLPYLQLIEIALLGVPFALHGIMGIAYLREAKFNSARSDGSLPSMPYPRNSAFTWQRITALIIAVGLIYHVVTMRFLRYPLEVGRGTEKSYVVETSSDSGLPAVAARLPVDLVTEETQPLFMQRIQQMRQMYQRQKDMAKSGVEAAEYEENIRLLDGKEKVIESLRPTTGKWYALSDDFGTACLITVRDTFRSWPVCLFYTLFVLMTCFHAGNGLWTSAIVWGVAVNERARRGVRLFSYGLMSILALWGLASIWLTYFVTLHR